MPETIEAKELQLLNIFNDAYLFEIPEYQRPYAWTTEQVGELVDDLFYAMERSDDVNEASPYFLGSIVIIKDSDPLSNIVDGQQRITTLTILFCVLRELSTDENKRNVLDKYVRGASDPFAGLEGQFRLSVRQRDREFFRNNVQGMNKLPSFLTSSPSNLADSQERMYENGKYMWDKLSEIDEQLRDSLTSFLVQHCYLVVVSTSDQSSAYRIFSVMNDRGLDLSPTDILKAEIIGALSVGIRSQYTEKWEDIEEELGRDNFRDLFAHIRMIYMKDKARGSLSDEFRGSVLKELNGKNFVDDVLETFADVYEAVSRSEYEGVESDKINVSLKHLGRLDNSDWTPPAMAFFKRNQNGDDLLLQFTRDLERLAYGMFIIRANVTERINRYARVLHAIERGDELFDDSSPLQLSHNEKNKILSALDGEIYQLTRVRKSLLLRLDGLLAGAGATYEHSIVTIEHVLPQNPSPGSEWNDWFPNSEVRERWTHRLANLVLLSRRANSRARNYEFDKKKQEYFQRKGVAPFALTTQVVNESEWTSDVLERRQRDLVDRLKDEWRLV